MSRLSLLLLTAFACCAAAVRADTIIFKTGEEMEGEIVEQDDLAIKLKVDYGTILVPMERVRRIDPDTPEKIKEREEKKAAAAAEAEKMKAEGKVQYNGKWITEDEKKAIEDKIAEVKQKKKEAAAAKKKLEEEEAKAKEAARQAQLAQQQQQADQQGNSRADRFSRRHGRDESQQYDRQGAYNSTQNQMNNYSGYQNNNSSSYNYGSNYIRR
jgi:hypothetical protein